jgi:hypothetical protein
MYLKIQFSREKRFVLSTFKTRKEFKMLLEEKLELLRLMILKISYKWRAISNKSCWMGLVLEIVIECTRSTYPRGITSNRRMYNCMSNKITFSAIIFVFL